MFSSILLTPSARHNIIKDRRWEGKEDEDREHDDLPAGYFSFFPFLSPVI